LGVVWRNIVRGGVSWIRTYNMVDAVMRKPEFEEYWIVFLVCCLCVFFILGCAKMENKEEVKTYPLPEEDPILEKLIELNIVDIDESN